MRIEDVLDQHEQYLHTLPNVIGTGIGERRGKSVIIVFVQQKVAESELQPDEIIPKILDGFDTDIREEIKIG